MTAQKSNDIPGAESTLACLLPLGSASFAERLLDSCNQAGVHHVDVVVSDYPENVRAVLGDGSAWGLHIGWHLAKNARSAYAVLNSLGFSAEDLVVIGHAHQWIAPHILAALCTESAVAMHAGADQELRWTGWCSERADILIAGALHEDETLISQSGLSRTGTPCVLCSADEYVTADSAFDLLKAQNYGQEHVAVNHAPASWRRMPWGAMSPDAIVSAEATLVAPVLVGPGCVVDSQACIGPDVVLSRDVFVASGAEIRKCVVLPNTYVDGRVTLDLAIVQGNSVQNLKWNVRMDLAPDDAMLAPLINPLGNRTPTLSRLLAVLLLLALSPFLLVAIAGQALLRQPLGWKKTSVVRSRNFETDALEMVSIRQPHVNGWMAGCTGLFGAMLDVMQGRRCWFGVRPRLCSEWYALGRDWQNLFGNSMIGVFHAPSWVEKPGTMDKESQAAADAFMAIHHRFADRVRLVWRLVCL